MATIHSTCKCYCSFVSNLLKADQRTQLLCGVRWRCRRWGSPSPRWSPSSPPCPCSAGSPSCCCRPPSSLEPSVSHWSDSSSRTCCFLGSVRSPARRGRPFAPWYAGDSQVKTGRFIQKKVFWRCYTIVSWFVSPCPAPQHRHRVWGEPGKNPARLSLPLQCYCYWCQTNQPEFILHLKKELLIHSPITLQTLGAELLRSLFYIWLLLFTEIYYWEKKILPLHLYISALTYVTKHHYLSAHRLFAISVSPMTPCHNSHSGSLL